MSLFYLGAVVNPVSHLSGLPVALVNEDQGDTVAGQHVNIGDHVASALRGSRAVTSRLSVDPGSLAEAAALMDRDGAYAAIVVPPNFTKSLLAAYGLTSSPARKPAIEILTNQRAGSIGVALATGVTEPALHVVSVKLGKTLSSQAAKVESPAKAGVVSANPITVQTTTYRPLPPNTALGASAFYVSILSSMCGLLGAILVNSTIDAALGYGTTEIGPRWSRRPPVAINRWQTLLSKWTVSLAIVPLLTGILLLVAVGILGMDAPDVGLLWVFTSFAAIAIAAGTLALLAAFGALGQLVAILLFVYLSLASSGGTIPLQALPSFFRFVANFEPLRQILGGVRAILYFGSTGDAGLTRGFVVTGIGLAFWLVAGFAVTKRYDRRGLDRIKPEELAFDQRAAADYAATTNPDLTQTG
jgi:YhgE/Pip-like protein